MNLSYYCRLAWAQSPAIALPSLFLWLLLIVREPVLAQSPDAPGDRMIEGYLRAETDKIETNFPGEFKTIADWQQDLPRLRQEYLYMLGLWPLPAREALQATITRTLARGEYQVDMLHYQSRPGLYVTGNLYRPSKVGPGERLPAIVYVCGHAPRGRNGNKTAYQSHGIWFARHGYVCLMLDTLQLGEIAGIHHGTYREGRWWWLSRGYTPAGVECWNGMRGIDYLVSRPEVDPNRIGVTGISGGGAATFWIAAADERVKVAVPVSGLTDLMSYVPDHVVNGHCDCMFLYNTYQWPWARIPSLIAPRPLLYINSDQDSLFPIEGDERVINRLERVYSWFGAGDVVDSLVSIGGHAYRLDIRQGAFRFLNTYLKGDPRPVLDTETDLVSGDAGSAHPIPPEQLRVFPQDTDLPAEAHNARIDQEFVPLGRPGPPQRGRFAAWRDDLLSQLQQVTFHHFPAPLPAARPVVPQVSTVMQLETEPGITVALRRAKVINPSSAPARRWLVAADLNDPDPTWWKGMVGTDEEVYVLQPRGVGDTRWTQKNPPNYVERAHYLLGRTVDSGRIWDLVAAARYLKEQGKGQTKLRLAGAGAGGVLAAYAALLETDIDEVLLVHPPTSHMDAAAPALLNTLRVCDIPEVLGMLAPRPVTVISEASDWTRVSASIYQVAGAPQSFTVRPR
jgi:dienelactone hydrolase